MEDFKKCGKKLCLKCNSVLCEEEYASHKKACWYKCIICHQLFIEEKNFLEHYIRKGNEELNNIIDKFNRKAKINKNKVTHQNNQKRTF